MLMLKQFLTWEISVSNSFLAKTSKKGIVYSYNHDGFLSFDVDHPFILSFNDERDSASLLFSTKNCMPLC